MRPEAPPEVRLAAQNLSDADALTAHDEELTLVWKGDDPGDSVKLTMRSMLLGGKSRRLFDVAPDVAP